MSIAGAVTSGLHAALLFARGRSDGLRYVEADMAGAARSFWAMALCLPAIVCLQLMTWMQSGVPPQAGARHRPGHHGLRGGLARLSRC